MAKTKHIIRIVLEIVLSLLLLATGAFFIFILYGFCLSPTGLFGMPNECTRGQEIYLLLNSIPMILVALFRPLKSKQHYLVSVIGLGITQVLILVIHGLVVASSGAFFDIDGIENGIAAVVISMFYLVIIKLKK